MAHLELPFSAVSPTAPSKCNGSAASFGRLPCLTLHCTGVIPGILGLGTLHSFASAQGRVQDLLLPTLRNFHFAPTLAKWPSAQYCSEPEQKGGSQWALGSCAVPAQREARLSGDFTRSTKPGRPFLSPKRAKRWQGAKNCLE